MRHFLKALSFIFVASLMACSEPSLVGEEILPDTGLNSAQFTDTVSILTFAEKEDSLVTDNLSLYNIGAIESPTFGKVVADLFAQVRLPSNEIDLGEGLIFDSLVLTLDYDFFYGDSVAEQTITVHQVTEDLVYSEDHYQFDSFSFDANEIGRLDNHIHQFSDSLLIEGNKIIPHLRIPLDPAIGQQFVDASGTDTFLNNDNFLDFFKGLYIQFDDANSQNNLMVAYDMASSLSTLSLYFRNGDSDTLDINFPINLNSEIVNHIQQDYSGSLAESYIDVNNFEGDSICFVQGQAGINTRLEFPYIDNIDDAVVNQATLTAYEIPRVDTDSIYVSPEIMFLARKTIDEDGSDGFGLISTADIAFEVDDMGNIVYKYEFNVVILMQDLLEGEGLDEEIFLVPASRQSQPRRVVLGGPNHPTYPMRLEIAYTPL